MVEASAYGRATQSCDEAMVASKFRGFATGGS